MEILTEILFWLGAIALFDGGLGLLLREKWQRIATGFDVQKIAIIEITVAFVLLTVHFLAEFIL